MNRWLQHCLSSTIGNCLLVAKHSFPLLLVLLVSCQKPVDEKPATQPLTVQSDPKTSATPTKHSDEAAPATMPKSEPTVEKTSVALTAEPMTPADFRARVEAVKQLGMNRSVEAVPLLIDGLMKITPMTSGNVLDIEESYPASAALVQIGEPAVAQVKKRFEATLSEPERLVLLHTLVRIKGKEWVVSYLTQVDERNDSSASKAKLGELKTWVTSL